VRSHPRLAIAWTFAALTLASAPSCSIKKFAVNKLGDALSETGTTYASDEDPELVRQALPFALKLIESLLDQSPSHRGLLTAAASGFTQYSFAFVQMEAEEIEEEEFEKAAELRDRARRFFLRARDYALRGLEVSHEGFADSLRADPESAVKTASEKDVPLLYWTAASWGLAISASKDDPEMLADLPLVETLIGRALEIDEDYDHGSLHEFMISLEGGRSEAMGGSRERARMHFERAMALSAGHRASPLVTYAETVSVGNQDKAEFVSLMEQAMAIDPDARPEWRLNNLIMQRRARWLMENIELLFLE
jgi:predicted anti-sigma-YlaC factor YlaD